MNDILPDLLKIDFSGIRLTERQLVTLRKYINGGLLDSNDFKDFDHEIIRPIIDIAKHTKKGPDKLLDKVHTSPVLYNVFISLGIYGLLYEWYLDTTEAECKAFVSLQSLLDYLKSKSPDLFKFNTSKYKVVYRGIRSNFSTIKDLLSNKRDWKHININGHSYYAYGKSTYTYNPHSNVQSWTVDIGIADKFAFNKYDSNKEASDSIILCTVPDNGNFYFNTDRQISTTYGMYNENETINISNEPIKTVLLINANKLGKDFFNDQSKIDLQTPDKIVNKLL